MATNQVLNATDRITEYPNRWKLTSTDEANVYDVEQVTGEVTNEGTKINRTLMNKIDNVLSYLTPTVERKEVKNGSSFSIATGTASSVDTTLAKGTTYSEIDATYPQIYSGVNIGLKITATNGITMQGAAASTSYPSNMDFNINSSGYYTKDFLLIILQKTDYAASTSIEIYNYLDYHTYFTFDLKASTSGNFNLRFNGITRSSVYVNVSDDGTNWTRLTEITSTTATSIAFQNKRYIQLDTVGTSSSTNYVGINYIYFSNLSGIYYYSTYNNNFTLDNNTSFTNGQRILVKPTSSITSISENYLNNIKIDTLLQPSSYYELIYNSSSNKFIAEERS